VRPAQKFYFEKVRRRGAAPSENFEICDAVQLGSETDIRSNNGRNLGANHRNIESKFGRVRNESLVLGNDTLR
jgi:hypothetical protein